jgi:hypothetical protein
MKHHDGNPFCKRQAAAQVKKDEDEGEDDA